MGGIARSGPHNYNRFNGRRRSDLPGRFRQHLSYALAASFWLASIVAVLHSFQTTRVLAAGTGSNLLASPDSVRYSNAVAELGATADSGASSDVTSKMTNNILTGAGATEDALTLTGNDSFFIVRRGVDPSTFNQILLRIYIASIDSPLRIKVYPYLPALTNISPASGEAYPRPPNTLTSSDITRPANSITSQDAGWVNVNVSRIAHMMNGMTDMKLRVGLESPDGSAVKASISEIMINYVSNDIPHDNYINLTTEWCGQCHSRHNGGQRALLRAPVEKTATPDIYTAGQQVKEEAICFVCHDGTGSTKDLRTEFRKSETAPGGAMRIWRYLGSHDRKESTGSGDPNTYVADGANGLQIINVSNPAAPVVTASVDTPGTAEDVYLMDNYAFVADGASGLQIIDVTDPLDARIVGSLDSIATGGYCGGIYVSSKDAYVACGQPGLRIVNVSNRRAPTMDATYNTPGSAEAVMVQGGTRPYTLNTPYGAPAAYSSTTYAYIADNTNGVVVIDVTNPAAPALIGSYNTAGEAKDISIGDFNGLRGFVADGSNGLVVLDISPAAPTLRGTYNTPGTAEGLYVTLDDSTADTSTMANAPVVFLADGSNGLVILDTNPAAPVLRGSYDTAGYAAEVNKVGTYAYVADDSNGLNVINVANYAALSLVGTYDTPGASKGISPTYSVHIECFDCHNPHLATYKDRYRGKRGINGSGDTVGWGTARKRLYQYEVCFRCHGAYFRQAVGRVVEDISRNYPYSNKQREFDPANSSYHPIEAPGRNRSVALNRQLQQATAGQPNRLSTADTIVCADCHNSNITENTAGPVANFTTVNEALGLHGSMYTTNKRAFFFNLIDGPTSYASGNFKLCFRCHYETCLTSQEGTSNGAAGDGTNECTNFYDSINGFRSLHWLHLIDRIGNSRATCKNCHYNLHSNKDAPNTQYVVNLVNYYRPPPSLPTRLVNFSPDIVVSGLAQRPRWWYNTVTRERRCYLTCHGFTMNGYQYRPILASLDVPIN